LQGRRLEAVFYPLKQPTPYAYGNKRTATQTEAKESDEIENESHGSHVRHICAVPERGIAGPITVPTLGHPNFLIDLHKLKIKAIKGISETPSKYPFSEWKENNCNFL
jgi:hypothetical protein